MKKLLARLAGLRLQQILVIGFVLTAAASIAVGTPILYGVINNYLEEAQDARVGRDMDLAEAFYNNKLRDIAATAGRIASTRSVRHNVPAAARGNTEASAVVREAIDNEMASLSPGTQRFIVVTDPQGTCITGQVSTNGRYSPAAGGADWSQLPIVAGVLAGDPALAATEVAPAQVLAWVHLAEQAHIPLIDTPKAAPQPYDPREGTAGLAIIYGIVKMHRGQIHVESEVGVGTTFTLTLQETPPAPAGEA